MAAPASRSSQNFENHVRHDVFMYAYVGMFLAAILLGVLAVALELAILVIVAVAVLAIACAFMAINARGYALKVQDRVICLETRLRLERVLPEDLAGRVGEFSLNQLVALRFASDGELPELARKVLEEGIQERAEIKKLVKDWQPDTMRV